MEIVRRKTVSATDIARKPIPRGRRIDLLIIDDLAKPVRGKEIRRAREALAHWMALKLKSDKGERDAI